MIRLNEYGKFKVTGNQNYVYHSYRKYHPVLCIYDAGITYPNTDYRYTTDRRFSANLFEYIVSGKGYIDSGGKRYTVSAGDCVFIDKNTDVTYFSDKDAPYLKLWFSTDGALTGKLCEAFGMNDGIYICKKNLYDRFQRLLHILENEGFELERISKHILGIALSMFTENSSDEQIPDEKLTQAQQIKAYIDAVIYSSPTVVDIAKHFGVCEATVIRHFKKEYGKTPNEYIKKQRMDIAGSMLRSTDYSVSMIAQLMNYCSQSYFSAEFKEKFGVYPTQYRENIRKNQ